MKLIVAAALLMLAGCAPHYEDGTRAAFAMPCNDDNCGKDPR